VTTGNTDGIISAYSTMRETIESLKDVKPWATDLGNKLDTLYKKDRYKVFEFVQAFNKNKLNYNVTEFNSATGGYKVINATSTNSRESQILVRWGFRFREKWLGGNEVYLSVENSNKISEIESNISRIFKDMKDEIRLAGNDTQLKSDAYNKAITPFFSELRDLGIFGLEDTDLNAYILLTGGTEKQHSSIDKLFSTFKFAINKTITMDGHKFSDKEGNYINPFRTESGIKTLAQAAAYRELDIAESTVLGPDGSTHFTYSNPTYINNKINEWKNDPSSLIELSKQTINGNSQWIRYLLASDFEHDAKHQAKLSQQRLDKLQSSIASSFTSVGKNDGVNNVQISLYDQINDNITKNRKRVEK